MRFEEGRKQAIVLYLLEKISLQTKGVVGAVSEALGISPNTVYTYLGELIRGGAVRKGKRGEYELVRETFSYTLLRSRGELDSDMHAYRICLLPHVAELPENVQQIWSYAFSEMVNNVMDHSEAEQMQVLVIKSVLKTSVLIVDNGVGIFDKIKKHFSLSDLDEAICELFKGKLTTDSDNHSGEGIFFTSKMMDEFLIVSGGKVFTTSRLGSDGVETMSERDVGTSVFMTLSNFTSKTAGEVFDLYSDDDGAFSKTRIPIKNVFDLAPISRSQAKRLCNRLDQFDEVTFDFDGISWMGQGFAHQLFVVFQNAHQSMRLHAVNMNESVANMYRHVTGKEKGLSH